MTLKDWVTFFLALILISGFLGVVGFVILTNPNGQNTDLLVGALITMAGSAVGFYFNTSLSSRSKDDTIHNLTNGKDKATP